MNRHLLRTKVALALLVIFISGLGLGWFGREARRERPLPPAAAAAPAAASHWPTRAIDTLARELQLTADQQAAIRPLLDSTAGRIELDRERALFQIHLQVLKVHDQMRPHLRPDQWPALDRMRARLRNDIQRRFASFLADPAQPSPDL